MTVVFGTAGHIDHGKTALLRALTGIDADRLPEEQRRGMTIDVGYAHLALPDGQVLDFVDVPGHDRLVGNMLVGAGEIDAALLVVAADDGPRAQTIEHLELLDALGIGVGIAVVTKIDVVDLGRVDDVVREVGHLLSRTTLAGSPILTASSIRGDGIDALRTELALAAGRIRAGSGDRAGRPPRLSIDRVFRVKGRGTVVTGTLRGGRLAAGDVLGVVPAVGRVRAREVQVHGQQVDAASEGGRVALNVVGAAELARGDVLTADRAVDATQEIFALLRPAARLDERATPPAWPPRPGSTSRFHSGTAHADAMIGRGPRALASLPDGRVVARVRIGRPLALAIGDAFVLRRPSPAAAIAGGIVLDHRPPVGPSRRRITAVMLASLAGAAASSPQAAAARLELHGALPIARGAPTGASPHAGWLLAADVEAAITAEAISHAEAGGATGVDLARLRPALVRRLRQGVTLEPGAAAGVVGSLIERLVLAGDLVREGETVRRPGVEAPAPDPAQLGAMDRLERELDVEAPPPLSEAARRAGCPPDGIRRLEEAGRLIRLDDDLAYARPAFERLQSTALGLARNGILTPAGLRDATGTSRKYVLALLEELDRRGVLRRTQNGHVVGPRAPS